MCYLGEAKGTLATRKKMANISTPSWEAVEGCLSAQTDVSSIPAITPSPQVTNSVGPSAITWGR